MSDENYGLIMPFLDASESFCHGYECGLLDQRMSLGTAIEQITVHTVNVGQIELICQKNGYRGEFANSEVEGWTYFEAKKILPKSDTRGLLQVIDGGKE